MPYSITKGHSECPDGQWAVVKEAGGDVLGCHDSEKAAQAQVRAVYAAESAQDDNNRTAAVESPESAEVAESAESPYTWEGVAAMEGVTLDHLIYALGSLRWPDLPLPLLMRDPVSDDLVTVGTVDTMGSGEGGIVAASGTIDPASWLDGFRGNPRAMRSTVIVDEDSADVTHTVSAECTEDADMVECSDWSVTSRYHDAVVMGVLLSDTEGFLGTGIHIGDTGGTPTEDTITAAAATYIMELPDIPPAEWFAEPTEDPDTGAITVTEDGRLYGYLAPSGVAHRGIRGSRVEVPMGRVDYSGWMNRVTITDDDGEPTRMATGTITMDCGHAATTNGPVGAARQQHYDDTCSIVATARVGENRHGVWIAGALLPDTTPDRVRKLMASQLSGDWGPHRERPGMLEMVAALVVPVPGFPRRSVRMSAGALVASTVPIEFVEESPVGTGDMTAEAHRMARDVGRDRESKIHRTATEVRHGM